MHTNKNSHKPGSYPEDNWFLPFLGMYTDSDTVSSHMVTQLQPEVSFQITVHLEGLACRKLGWKDIGPALVQEAAHKTKLLSPWGKCQRIRRAGRGASHICPHCMMGVTMLSEPAHEHSTMDAIAGASRHSGSLLLPVTLMRWKRQTIWLLLQVCHAGIPYIPNLDWK